MDPIWPKRGHAQRDILSIKGRRICVSNLNSFWGDDRFTGAYYDRDVIQIESELASNNDNKLIELGSLIRLSPSWRGNHMSQTKIAKVRAR